MKILFFILLFASNSSFAFNKDFNLVNDRAPLEFKLMFESMKYTLKDASEQIRLIVLAQHINKGLGPLAKDQSFFLLKSEVYKTLLEWPHPPSQFQVGSHTLERMKSNLVTNKAIYTPYSKWVLEALVADLENFQKEGILDMTSNQRANLNSEKTLQYSKMQRVLKHTRGWLEQADTLSAKDFNGLTEQLAWRTLERVKEKAALFRRFSSKAIQDTQVNTFNIPENGMPQLPKAGPAPVKVETSEKGLADKAAEEKVDAQEAVDKMNVNSAAIPADELSSAIDQIEEDSQPGGTAQGQKPTKPAPGSIDGMSRPAPVVEELE
ncbi:MAG: hypothetical protein K2P81_07475 [Bacteriovoracaceae bacterium]|nr:hypothetical protein [Bacteriovoracaceae bacterium]